MGLTPARGLVRNITLSVVGVQRHVVGVLAPGVWVEEMSFDIFGGPTSADLILAATIGLTSEASAAALRAGVPVITASNGTVDEGVPAVAIRVAIGMYGRFVAPVGLRIGASTSYVILYASWAAADVATVVCGVKTVREAGEVGKRI